MPTTVLAVDDSVTMRKVLEITFAGEDFRVVTADSADAGLAKMRAEHPVLVLADLTLDGTNGYGLCTKIKAESPGTLVILLASKQQPYDAGKGAAARADDFIEKPFDTQQLIDKVRKVLTQQPAAPAAAPQRAPAPVAAAPAPVAAAPAGYSPQAPGVAPRAPAAAAPAVGAGGPPARPAVGMPLNVRPTAPGVGMSGAAAAAVAGAGTPAPPVVEASHVGRGTLNYGPSAAGQIRPADPTTNPTPVTGVPRTPAAASSAPAAQPAIAHAAAATSAPVVAAVAEPPVVAVAVAVNGALAGKLAGLGLSETQVAAVLALSREVVERVVWEVVPVLAETMIKEEIRRLTSE